jgi:hypothetical protein
MRELRHGPDLRGVFPVFQFWPGLAADTGDEAFVGIPSRRKHRIREPFGLRHGNRAVEDFGATAAGPVEDLLIDFPSWLGDIRPPLSERGALQIVVHFRFLPREYVSRSVLASIFQAV